MDLDLEKDICNKVWDLCNYLLVWGGSSTDKKNKKFEKY